LRQNGRCSLGTGIAAVAQPFDIMGLTLDQRWNHDGFPKPGELIEITGAHDLEACDRAIFNLLYQHAHRSGRMGDATAAWEIPITALRTGKHDSTDWIRKSLERLLSVQVKVTYRDSQTGRDRVLMTHLFESFDLPADGAAGGPVRYRVPVSLLPVLSQSSRWGRIKTDAVCAMTSKYAIALYELVQLRANLDRCIEAFPLVRFRELLGVPPGAYERGNDFVSRVVDPAVIQVNGLSEYGVKVDVERPHRRAPITSVVLGWWPKHGDEFRAVYRERDKPKRGRMARLRGQAGATATPSPALIPAPAPPAPAQLSLLSSIPARPRSGKNGQTRPA
jgi:Initiator Replication protein